MINLDLLLCAPCYHPFNLKHGVREMLEIFGAVMTMSVSQVPLIVAWMVWFSVYWRVR